MRVMSFVSLSAALMMSTAALAETKTQAEPGQREATKAAPAPKKICKRLATTGSRMEERVCLTKEEWKLVEKEVEE
jgi:hypothetical protein